MDNEQCAKQAEVDELKVQVKEFRQEVETLRSEVTELREATSTLTQWFERMGNIIKPD